MMGYRVCKICRGVYPDDSDILLQVWRKKKVDDVLNGEFVGYFCELCLPASVTEDQRQMILVVPRFSNK